MALEFGFYDSYNGDRRYNARQMNGMLDGIINDGVYASVGNKFFTTPGTGMQVVVGTGRAWFKETWNHNTAPIPLDLDQADPVYSRIDIVALKVDKGDQARENSVVIHKGSVMVSPTPPILPTTDTTFYLPLAYVTIRANASNILASDIDILVGKSQCPFVTSILQQTNIDTLFANWNQQFTDWWTDIKATLNENVVTELINRIDQRVKISDLATEAEAKAGTSNDKWMSPARVKSVIDEFEKKVGIQGQSIGHIFMDAGLKVPPPNYLRCDGKYYKKSEYPALFDAIDLGYMEPWEISRTPFSSSTTDKSRIWDYSGGPTGNAYGIRVNPFGCAGIGMTALVAALQNGYFYSFFTNNVTQGSTIIAQSNGEEYRVSGSDYAYNYSFAYKVMSRSVYDRNLNEYFPNRLGFIPVKQLGFSDSSSPNNVKRFLYFGYDGSNSFYYANSAPSGLSAIPSQYAVVVPNAINFGGYCGYNKSFYIVATSTQGQNSNTGGTVYLIQGSMQYYYSHPSVSASAIGTFAPGSPPIMVGGNIFYRNTSGTYTKYRTGIIGNEIQDFELPENIYDKIKGCYIRTSPDFKVTLAISDRSLFDAQGFEITKIKVGNVSVAESKTYSVKIDKDDLFPTTSSITHPSITTDATGENIFVSYPSFNFNFKYATNRINTSVASEIAVVPIIDSIGYWTMRFSKMVMRLLIGVSNSSNDIVLKPTKDISFEQLINYYPIGAIEPFNISSAQQYVNGGLVIGEDYAFFGPSHNDYISHSINIINHSYPVGVNVATNQYLSPIITTKNIFRYLEENNALTNLIFPVPTLSDNGLRKINSPFFIKAK